MSVVIWQITGFFTILVTLSIPLGNYIHWVMTRERMPLDSFAGCVREMSAKHYALSALAFSGIGFVFVFALQLLQGWLPFNPAKLPGTRWDLAFNTAASFVSNTNWQAYSGETTLSYLTQCLGLAVQNFVSAATGIAVLFALIRGFTRRQSATVGNFWVDLTRSTLYILLPLSLVLAVILVSQGVVQSFGAYRGAVSLESGTPLTIPLGPAASQIAIKQLGTNGGGFFGANSAFPLENATPLSNLLQMLSIILISAGLCVSFGIAVKDRKQGRVIYAVMLVLLIASIAAITASEFFLGPNYAGVAAGGNMEGKETMHGIGASSLWAAATTAASNGSVNSMHDSLTPIGGLVPLFLMQVGEIVFGGVGSGLYGMLAFVLMTVFIAGLMVGRTPEYLGKKIEAFDMKMVCLIILVPPLLSLLGTAAAVMMPEAASWLSNRGAHGFTEILYAFSSMANNNGSAFAGLAANAPFTNLVGGTIMLTARFVPLVATVLLAGNLAGKKNVAAGEGTLSTCDARFAGLLVAIILIVGALTFLPALALGPIADFAGTL